jgi:hypothetical protein
MVEAYPTNRTFDRAAWLILAVALAFSCFVRCRLAEFPLERDEGEYAYVGQLILQGTPPFNLAYSMKLPGTPLAYAGLMATFGQTTSGIHWGLLTVNLASIVLLFLLTRDMFDAMTGAVAAAAFSIMSVSPSVLGMAAHATHFVAIFGIAGVWVLWRAMQTEKMLPLFAAGVLLGLAFLMKQQGVFLIAFGGLTVIVSCIRRQPAYSLRQTITACLLFAVGAVLPFVATCLWLWLTGTFGSFWFWTVAYARTYVNWTPTDLAIQRLFGALQGVAAASWPIWIMAIIGTVAVARSNDIPRRRAFVLAFFVFSLLCVCPGLIFRAHYFIVFLPVVAMLAGVGAVAIVRAAPRGAPSWLAAAILLVAIAFPVWQQRDFCFSWTPEQACRRTYPENPFVECPVIADYIEKHSRPGDRVAVVGSEPEIYFHSQRRSATGYIYMYPLMEPHLFAHAMQDEMIREIESAKPEFLVFVDVPKSWLKHSASDFHILKWFADYAAAAYRPVGLVDMISEDSTDYKWDAQVVGAKPRSQRHVWIYRKKS